MDCPTDYRLLTTAFMNIDLTGKVAIITGAAQGIGLGITKRLTASGAKVLLADIQEEKGQEVAKTIEGSSFVHADVSREKDIKQMIETAVERFGRLDILVNNAWAGKVAPATELESDEWDKGYAVLVKAIYLASKYAIPHLKNAGGGSIINISSILAHRAKAQHAIYTSAKGAVLHLTRQLAVDYGPDNVRVNTISPGDIRVRPPYDETPDTTSLDVLISPIRRSGRPMDIANAVCFLVSEQASFINGAELVVDGGLMLPFVDDSLELQRTYLEKKLT
jgi:NAD(P)-dependent dehydrogenase (short-subunit alcohol dehydrogenase family)